MDKFLQPKGKSPLKKCRLLMSAAASAAAITAMVTAAAPSANASTIPVHHAQLCAQGNYTAQIVFPNRGYFSSTYVQPGQCWYVSLNSKGWEPVEIYGFTNPSSPYMAPASFYLGEQWYNGDTDGIGIGAEGSASGDHWIWTW